MIAGLDEIFASSWGVAHPAHCLTGKDAAFVSGNNQLEYVHGRHADKTSGPQSGYRANGGAVALMVELMSRHATWPDDAPLPSYRISGSYRPYTVNNMANSRRVSNILGKIRTRELRGSRERAPCGVAPRRVGATLLL